MTDCPELSRRNFLNVVAASAPIWVLACQAGRARAFEGAAASEALSWVRDVEGLSQDLSTGVIAPAEWQSGLESFLSNVPLTDILSAIDFETLADATPLAKTGVATARAPLPCIGGAPHFVYTKLFAVGDKRAVISHGHVGMASGHLVLKGKFRLRQYDRVEIADEYWTLRPTIDRMEHAGGVSTISDDRNNIHWLVAEGDAYTLDFIMAPALKNNAWTVQNLDIDAAATTRAGLLRTPKIDVQGALDKYG